MNTQHLRIALSQSPLKVGNVAFNTAHVLALAKEMRGQADFILFPELTLCGYPPEDLLSRPEFQRHIRLSLETIRQQIQGIGLIIGHPHWEENSCFNTLSVIENGEYLGQYYKQKLPNYGVFDEKRYFSAGNTPLVIHYKGYSLGFCICEDLWSSPVAQALKASGADCILSMNASPYDIDKPLLRRKTIQTRAKETGLPILYVANVGGQDEIIYDGGSCMVDGQGQVKVQVPFFTPDVAIVELNKSLHCLNPQEKPSLPSPLEGIYQAIKMGIRDYVHHNGFQSVVLGVSGGLDSALVLALAVEALGPENVHGLGLPSRYTSQLSLDEGRKLCENFGVSYDILSIEPSFQQLCKDLLPILGHSFSDLTLQNLQARCRGILLMAYSNQKSALLLATGNKSELAVGYCTLYGDMAGAYAPIKDVYKTTVFELARYHNSLGKALIPEAIITRPPSAELAPNQLDSDNLPPYPILDEILTALIEADIDIQALCQRSHLEPHVVYKVAKLVHQSEYKRRQGPVGPKLSIRDFAKERRYPLTCGEWWN